MTRIASFLVVALLISVVGCGKKTPPPSPVVPDPVTGVLPPPAEKDKDKVVVKDKEPAVDPTRIDPTGKGALTRDQFRLLVKGKTKEEVERRLGKPETTQEDGDDEYWFYHDRTRDEDGSIDDVAHVVMHKGIVQRVNFGGAKAKD